MANRIASAVLWFIAVGWAFNFLTAYLNVSPLIGLLVAGASSTFIALDPVHQLWPTKLEPEPKTTSSPTPSRHQPSRTAEAI
jgi:hypothetical protein